MTDCQDKVEAAKEKRDELIFDLIKRRYDSELQRANSIDSKGGNLIGFVSVVVGLLIGLGGFQTLNQLKEPEYWAIYFGGIVLLLLSIVFCLYAVKVRKWTFVPNAKYLWDKYTEEPYRKVIRRNAAEMASAVEEMEEANNDKAEWVDISWFLLIVGLTIVFIFLVVVSATGAIKPAAS